MGQKSAVNVSGETTREQSTSQTCPVHNGSLKDMFVAYKLWLPVNNDYPILSDKAIKVSPLFVTTYLCEIGFSAVTTMKTKHQ
jgi:hypothetical protein